MAHWTAIDLQMEERAKNVPAQIFSISLIFPGGLREKRINLIKKHKKWQLEQAYQNLRRKIL